MLIYVNFIKIHVNYIFFHDYVNLFCIINIFITFAFEWKQVYIPNHGNIFIV